MPTFNFKNKEYSIISLINEIWKEFIRDDNNIYYISNKGRVKCDNRFGIHILKQNIGNGYKRVHIFNKMYFVHRLVAIAFIENINNYCEVNHKDFNKLNNNADNLEWVTPKQNSQYNINNKVLQIDPYTKDIINEFNSTSEAAIFIKGDRARIAACCKNKYGCKSHKGYFWKYKYNTNNIKSNKKKIILQIDKYNNIIHEFNSLGEAAKYFNVGKTAIHNVIKGYSKSCKGFKFEYKH